MLIFERDILALDEDKTSDLKKANPQLANDIQKMSDADPTPTKKYIQYNTKALVSKEASVDDIIGVMTRFEKFGNKLQKKDIYQWKFSDLVKELDKFKDTVTNKEKSELASKGAEKIFEDDKSIVYFISSKDASCKYGKGTKWCITAADEKHFENYRENNVIFYFIISKNTPADDPYHKVAVSIERDSDNKFSPSNSITIFDAEDNELPDRFASGFMKEFNAVWSALTTDAKNRGATPESKIVMADDLSKVPLADIKASIERIVDVNTEALKTIRKEDVEVLFDYVKGLNTENSEYTVIKFAAGANVNMEKYEKYIFSKDDRAQDFVFKYIYDREYFAKLPVKNLLKFVASKDEFTVVSTFRLLHNIIMNGKKDDIDIKLIQDKLLSLKVGNEFNSLVYLYTRDIRGDQSQVLDLFDKKFMDRLFIHYIKTAKDEMILPSSLSLFIKNVKKKVSPKVNDAFMSLMIDDDSDAKNESPLIFSSEISTLNEDKTSDLKKANPQLANDIQKMSDADPTPTKKYIRYNTNVLVNKEASVDDIIAVMNTFEKFGPKLQKKDIYQWNFIDLKKELEKFKDVATNKEKSELATQGAEKLYEDDDMMIYHIETEEASCKYGQRTKWCISGDVDNQFKSYKKRNVLFYFIISKTKPLTSPYRKVAYAVIRTDENVIRKIEMFDAKDKNIKEKDIIAKFGASAEKNIFQVVMSDARKRKQDAGSKISLSKDLSEYSLDDIKEHIEDIITNSERNNTSINTIKNEYLPEIQRYLIYDVNVHRFILGRYIKFIDKDKLDMDMLEDYVGKFKFEPTTNSLDMNNVLLILSLEKFPRDLIKKTIENYLDDITTIRQMFSLIDNGTRIGIADIKDVNVKEKILSLRDKIGNELFLKSIIEFLHYNSHEDSELDDLIGLTSESFEDLFLKYVEDIDTLKEFYKRFADESFYGFDKKNYEAKVKELETKKEAVGGPRGHRGRPGYPVPDVLKNKIGSKRYE